MDKQDITKYLEKQVYYRGRPYILKGVTIRRHWQQKHKLFYEAELMDVKQNKSLLICDIMSVETELPKEETNEPET